VALKTHASWTAAVEWAKDRNGCQGPTWLGDCHYLVIYRQTDEVGKNGDDNVARSLTASAGCRAGARCFFLSCAHELVRRKYRPVTMVMRELRLKSPGEQGPVRFLASVPGVPTPKWASRRTRFGRSGALGPQRREMC
jgi:hypothetical protein